MVELLRHRQTKEAATDMLSLNPPPHISTLPAAAQKRTWPEVGQGPTPDLSECPTLISCWRRAGRNRARGSRGGRIAQRRTCAPRMRRGLEPFQLRTILFGCKAAGR